MRIEDDKEVWILFSVGPRWYHFLSKAIMSIEGTNYSHVALYIKNNDEGFVYEAVHPESKKTSFNKWLSQRKMVRSIYLKDPDDINKAIAVAESELGIKYSYTQLVFILVGKIFKPVDDVKLNNQRGLVCTELAGRFLSKIYGSKFDKSFDSLGLVDIYKEASNLSMSGDIL